MAKKKKNKNAEFDEQLDGEENKEGGSGVVTTIVGLFIILIWLAIFGFLIKMDVGGFGTTVLRPILKDVPLLNLILPSVPDDQVAGEENYPYNNLRDAMKRITELEAELASANDKDGTNTDYIDELLAEIDRLKVFEEAQKNFADLKKEFDNQVVYADAAPSTEEYKAWYEQIEPETAAEIYRQVVEQQKYDGRVADQAAMYTSMEPKDAAAILETMTGDLDLVAKILTAMKAKQSGAILAEMNINMAAKLTKKMYIMD